MSGNIGPVEEGRRDESFDETGQSLELESAGQPICTEPETPNLNQESPKNYFSYSRIFGLFSRSFKFWDSFLARRKLMKMASFSLSQ